MNVAQTSRWCVAGDPDEAVKVLSVSVSLSSPDCPEVKVRLCNIQRQLPNERTQSSC